MKNARQLIQESEGLIELAGYVQDETQSLQDRQAKLKELSDLYHAWYHNGIALFDVCRQPEERIKFEKEYEGSFWTNKIIKFLTSGLEHNPLYIPNHPLVNKYTYPYVGCFKEPLHKQCNSLARLEIIAARSPLNPDEDASWNATIRRVFSIFLEIAEKAETNHAKKLSYEYLAIFLMGAIEGLKIIGHDERGASEEVDVWIANEAEEAFWQQMGGIFIVECKHWGKPVGAEEIRDLRTVMNDKNVQLAILLSRNGVTGDKWHDAVDSIRKAHKEGKNIIVLDQNDLQAIAGGIHPAKQIQRKFYELVMKS